MCATLAAAFVVHREALGGPIYQWEVSASTGFVHRQAAPRPRLCSSASGAVGLRTGVGLGAVMSQENVDVVRRLNSALNAREYSVLERHIDPEAEFTNHLPLPDIAPSAHGRDEARAVLDAWSHGFQGFEAHVVEYVDLGEFVVAVTKWKFVSRDKGIEVEWPGAEAWQIRDGKVVWGEAGFRDKDAALDAVEQRK
jgi:limonene-1,2-epoxide hydrolase